MFEFSNQSKNGLLKAATIVASMTTLQSPLAYAADDIELKPLSPQIDKAPPVEEATPPRADQTPKLHKLEATKLERLDDSDDQEATVQVEQQGPQAMKQIVINSYVMRANLPSTVISDPFTLMRALLGARSKEYEKLYAERDTGYGVCGFLMNMPITQRGYALVLKCFPSMPAAEANLQPGDLITSVNGQSTLDLPPKEVWDWFTGMPGTEVKIEVLRGRQPISVTLKRMDIGHIPDFATRAEFLTLYKHNGVSKFVQK
ncbi:MAG: PDZ domain-containing protein [Cyanobacteria bacterium SZAS-4]|nr:PDZ domain-containing protein [Cyanobacteria bacterium SZAS-4]